MKKKKAKVFLLTMLSIATSYLLNGCDTREDWFEREGEGATFVYERGDKRVVLGTGNLKNVHDTIHVVRIDNSNKTSYSDTFNIKVYGMTNRVKSPTVIKLKERDMTLVTKAQPDGSVNVFYASNCNSIYMGKDGEETFGGENGFVCSLKDVFGHEYHITVYLRIQGDCPPVPKLEVKDVDGYPLEKTLSMKGSYDPDGNVAKYEYCIDGNIATYKERSTRYECIDGMWQAGKAAYGGTYITATAIDEVSHAFQEAGEHTIYYRCMDNLGVWSMWYKEVIAINNK